MLSSPQKTSSDISSAKVEAATPAPPAQLVTARALALGFLLACAMAGLNCWIETLYNVHFLGGTQMAFGAVFVLLVLVLLVNGPMKRLKKAGLSAAELLTVYSMTLFGLLISAPGADNFFIITGPALFYFSKRDNGWAELFYKHIPPHFAPGWDGKTYQRDVIEKLYVGGVPLDQIPWHAWSAMLIAWCVLLLLVYASLFFFSLLLRRQWIENEALSFPLVQVPLQMVDAAPGQNPPSREFWGNRLMWGGVAFALFFHLLRGLNYHSPAWPVLSAFQGNIVRIDFTEKPWNAMGYFTFEFYFGAIGIAYLLTREVSLSFWLFYLIFKFEYVLAEKMGFPVGAMPTDTYVGRPIFLTFQSIGGWGMMAAILLWTARRHLQTFARAAWRGQLLEGEPFSPRWVLMGFLLSSVGLLAWSWFSGINLLFAAVFFGLYLLCSIVLARLVVEGGFLYPQVNFAPMEIMTTTLFGTATMGAQQITRLSFVQPSLFADMRTIVLPGFLHTLKIAHELRLEARQTRRLMLGIAAAIVAALGITSVVTIASLYGSGGLTGYDWFAVTGPQINWRGTQSLINMDKAVEPQRWFWMGIGAAIVWGLTAARAHLVWFPLHPLGYIMASSYPVTRLWGSFFTGWLIKSLLLRFGGNDAVVQVRPFMIGLILGNIIGMVLWMLYGFYRGVQVPYWPS